MQDHLPDLWRRGRRETDTMDTFVDSSWYYMRYADPLNDQAPFDREIVDAWLPVDQYIGGIEHAVLHLLYARFFTKALYDLGYVGFTEPFANLFTQGMIYYQGAKMAKSRGNVISPDDDGRPVRRGHRAAVFAVSGTAGSGRRVVRRGRRRRASVPGAAVAAGERVGGRDRRRACPTRPRPTGRARRWCERPTGRSTRSPATSAAGLPSTPPSRRCTSWWATSKTRRRRRREQRRFALAAAVSLIQPFAPHVACELWQRMGGERLWDAPWPQADPALLVADEVTYAVQVNGKLRGEV